MLFELLLVDMDCSCMRTGFEVHACTVSLPHIRKKNLFLKLICVIQICMREIFVGQYHPQYIINLELFQATVHVQ